MSRLAVDVPRDDVATGASMADAGLSRYAGFLSTGLREHALPAEAMSPETLWLLSGLRLPAGLRLWAKARSAAALTTVPRPISHRAGNCKYFVSSRQEKEDIAANRMDINL